MVATRYKRNIVIFKEISYDDVALSMLIAGHTSFEGSYTEHAAMNGHCGGNTLQLPPGEKIVAWEL